MKHQTLGGRAQHIYVTRNAALEYQKLSGAGFETARRSLTERLLSAYPEPGGVACAYLCPVVGDARLFLRAFVVREGALLVVTKVNAIPNPLRASA